MPTRECKRSGREGFVRLRGEVAEATGDAVSAARSWLLSGEAPQDEVEVRDAWHGRCVGAAISAAVVPAVTPGVPVWRVGDRLLWPDGERLATAARGAWPEWAGTVGTGASSEPVPGEQIAAFAATIAALEAPVVEDLRAAVDDLGLATTDPDTQTTEANGDVTIRLRQPAGGSLSTHLGEDGTVRTWSLGVAFVVDSDVAAQAGASTEVALTDYRVPDRKRGWQIGIYTVSGSQGHPRDPSYTLTGRHKI